MIPIVKIEEKQKVALDILIYIDEVCSENDIDYSLAYGTMLGAVRHNGFIPWDDDVDIMMTRSNYYKFVDVLSEQKSIYRLESFENNKYYELPLAKVIDTRTILLQEYGYKNITELGIYVDVFVVDNMPSEEKVCAEFYKKAHLFRRCWEYSVLNVSRKYYNLPAYVFRKLISFACRCFGYRYFMKRYDRHALKYSNANTGFAGIVIYGEGYKKELFPSSYYTDLVRHKFEDKEFLIPREYDLYLKQMYGDYMQLPPEEDRKVHMNKTYWKD